LIFVLGLLHFSYPKEISRKEIADKIFSYSLYPIISHFS